MKFINLLNATRCKKTLRYENEYSIFFLIDVKTSFTWRQSAWASNSSETKRRTFSNYLFNRTNFNNWLVGFTDGDGMFYFDKTKKNSWTFSFQIQQNSYNLRSLIFIKSKLHFGKISIDTKNKTAVYRVRNKKHLRKSILPIFGKNRLLTKKYFKYECFRNALLVDQNLYLSKKEKEILLSNIKIKSNKMPNDYKSPVWNLLKKPLKNATKNSVSKILKKPWLIGFTEAEGSFYIVQKSSKHLLHAFEITQKSNFIVLQAIATILELTAKKKNRYFNAVTTNSKSIKKIINYFYNELKSMKALEFKIWSKSFNKKQKNFKYLLQVQNKMQKLKSMRFDKNFKLEKEYSNTKRK
jgi:hypothetical protein